MECTRPIKTDIQRSYSTEIQVREEGVFVLTLKVAVIELVWWRETLLVHLVSDWLMRTLTSLTILYLKG